MGLLSQNSQQHTLSIFSVFIKPPSQLHQYTYSIHWTFTQIWRIHSTCCSWILWSVCSFNWKSVMLNFARRRCLTCPHRHRLLGWLERTTKLHCCRTVAVALAVVVVCLPPWSAVLTTCSRLFSTFLW